MKTPIAIMGFVVTAIAASSVTYLYKDDKEKTYQ